MAKTVKDPNAPKKEKKKAEVLTDAQLTAKGIKGNVLLVVRKAFNLATRNKFEGTKQSGKKYPNGILYSKTPKDGSYWKVSETSDSFKALHSAAKSALGSLQKMSYDSSVKKLVDAFTELEGAGGGGRSFSVESLKNVTL